MSTSIKTNNLNTSKVDDRAFWKERLEDLRPLTVPFIERALSSNQYANQIKAVPDELSSSLRESFPDSKPADILLAAFASYMARINTTACFDIGFASSELELEVDLEGLFAVYIPCRIEIDLEKGFSETSNVIKKQIESALVNQGHISKIITSDPILDALPKSDNEKILPIAFRRVPNLEDSHTSQVLGRDLTVIIPDCGTRCCLIYDSNNLKSESVIRIWQQFQTFLSSIVKNPDKHLIYQSLLPESERQKIWEWNQSQNKTQDKCIQQLFEEQVERTPDAVAVEYRDLQLTYRELNERANQLAHYLRDLGVGPEVLVGFYVNRSLEMLVGMLGVLKAGGAYVPLDPAYPLERLTYMAEDSKISILLTQDRLISRLPEHQARVVVDSDWSKIALHSRENPTMKNTTEDLAYVIYTSGSTGKPKGVMITHSALSNFAQTALAEYKIEQSDRVLQFASINFDIAVEEIYTCLLAGSTLVLRTDEMLADMKTFCQTCQKWQLTILNLPTAYWHQLMAELAIEAYFPESVRLVIIGGEKVLSEPVKHWQEYVNRSGKSDRLQLINSYGPTETTVSATLYRIPTDADTIKNEVPIGRPFGHLQTHILDRYGQPVPIGVPGELHIGGSSLARGYLNRPELTKEKFIPNFLSQESGARLYKTGDLVRYLPAKDTALHNGNIEYIGRIDEQVKIRGFRIELGEIETVIAQHPDVLQTAVIAREDIPGDKRLVAYIVPQQQLPIGKLRSFLQERLPHYMVPTAYVKLDSLPITPGGKIDRQALPAPEFDRSELGKTVAPRNDLEFKIATIWEEILNTSPIGVQDNFFDLGGHSLLAVSLLTRIEKTFQKNISLTTFLSTPTVEGVAKVISQESSASESLIFNIRTTGSKPPLFLINAMGTGMLAYKLLTKYLDPEIPVYGIRAIGMDDQQEPQNRIEQMAETYIQEMLAVQPEGPYCVAGVCTGGTVAFEIASQLRSRGLEVAFLGLIDSTARPILSDDLNCISTNETEKPLLSKFFDRYIKHNFILRGGNNLWAAICDPKLKLKDKLSFTFDMVQQLYQKIGHKLEAITYNGKQQSLPYKIRRARVFDAGMEALSHYTPRAYEGGKVILIRANDNPEHIHYNHELGWDEFITNVEVAEIPADQTTLLFEPHIRTLAAKLNSCLVFDD